MGCGCKNKTTTVQQTNSESRTNDTSNSSRIQEFIKKYYKKN